MALSCFSLHASNSLEEVIRISDGVIAGHIEEILEDSIVIRPTRWLSAVQNSDQNFHVLNVTNTQFEVGEHIIVLIKLNNGKNTLIEHALNKFSVRRIGARKIVINNNTDLDPLKRQYKLNEFFKEVEAVKNEKFFIAKLDYQKLLTRKRHQLSLQRSKRPRTGRSIASVESKSSSNSQGSNHISSMWLLLLLGFLGTVVRAVYKKT